MIEPIYTNPTGLDLAAKELGEYLKIKNTWLDRWFGVSERKVEGKGEMNIRSKPYYDISYPAVYSGKGNSYINLLPNSKYGNYGYLDFDDMLKVDHKILNPIMNLNMKGQIVLWWDYRKIYGADFNDYRNWNVIEPILKDLGDQNFTNLDKLEITNVNFRVQEIFDDYNHKELENQFAMRPYGIAGINLKFNVKIEILCD